MPLSERLAAHCGDDFPIYLDNDTNLAALGEHVFGAGDGIDNMVVVMVGTAGIGAGIIVNGEIYHSAGGGAGEIGHMPVADNDVRISGLILDLEPGNGGGAVAIERFCMPMDLSLPFRDPEEEVVDAGEAD